jgi:hypothetical protein
MKKILVIIIITIFLVTMFACKREVENPIPPITNKPYELIVKHQAIERSIKFEDLSDYPLRQVEIEQSPFEKLNYAAIRVRDLLQTEPYQNGLNIYSEDEQMYMSYRFDDIYLFIGIFIDDQLEQYSEENIVMARIKNRKVEVSVQKPTHIQIVLPNEAKQIHYIYYHSIAARYDLHTSLRAMQGIVNREKPNLLTISTSNPYFKDSDETWLFILEQQGYQLKELFGLEEVLYTFKDYFKGIITFRDRLKSYNNWVSAESDFALMMASLHDFAPLPFGLQDVMSSLTGLEIIDRFTVSNQEVLGDITKYLQQENLDSAFLVYERVFNHMRFSFNTKAYMSLTSEVMDYAASEKMMFFDLKATQEARDHELSKAINQHFKDYNDYFEVYGWVDHESSALDFISSYGGVIDVVGNGNLSLLSRLDDPKDEPFVQKAQLSSDYDSEKKYVTFIASESDTIKVGVSFQHGAWLDENRGKVAINWGLIADMSFEFPFAFRHFYESATPNDYFYSGGGSGIGFVDIDSDMDLVSRNKIAERNHIVLTNADQHIIDMYNDRYTPTDPFEKDVIGAYLKRSNIDYAFARIHDGNQTIRIENWQGVNVYNRWTNFYPRRPSSDHFRSAVLNKITPQYYLQESQSDYWFIETDIANTNLKTGFDLFTDGNQEGYRVYFQDGQVVLAKKFMNEEIEVQRFFYNVLNKKVKISIDKSTPLDDFVHIRMYVNDLVVIDYYDQANSFTKGGFAMFSELSVEQAFSNINGSNQSMAMAVYQRILNSRDQFIMPYYGFVGGEDHTKSMYRSEPGVGKVMSLSPTDFYKIKLLLDLNYPNTYEIVNALEFMTFATQYQNYYGTLR